MYVEKYKMKKYNKWNEKNLITIPERENKTI